MGLYNIRQLEQYSGVKAHTIRVWEKRYEALKPERTDTNIRLYSDDDLKRLINIALLKRRGFKISKIAKLSNKEISEKILHLFSANLKMTDVIESMIIAMIDFDEARFTKVFGDAVMNFGFEKTIVEVVFPFLGRVGLLWQTGEANPAQEHFVSNIVRQKILVATDAIDPFPKLWSKKFLLFLPEGEYHELLLLFTQYLLRRNNHRLIYLGQNVPYNEVIDVAENYKPDVLMFSSVVALQPTEMKAYLNRLQKDTDKLKIWILTKDESNEMLKNADENIEFVTDAQKFQKLLMKIKYDS